jgi:hypothetical protein
MNDLVIWFVLAMPLGGGIIFALWQLIRISELGDRK